MWGNSVVNLYYNCNYNENFAITFGCCKRKAKSALFDLKITICEYHESVGACK